MYKLVYYNNISNASSHKEGGQVVYYNLQSERKKAKLTQENMAALLEMSLISYQRKETDVCPFWLDEAKKIQAIINAYRDKKGQEGLPLDYLFLRE